VSLRLDEPIRDHLRHDYTPLHVGQTVGEALALVRANPPGGRVIYFYVIDDDGRLRGIVPTRRLLLSPLEAKLDDIMVRRVVTLPESATVLDACEFFTLHKFLAFPVVDREGRLLGLVDIELYTDELTDLAQRTSYDDLFQLVGVRMAEARMGSPLNAFRARFPWLTCNIAGGILAAFLTGWFQDTLDRHLVLALFIPVVLALSESVSIQSVSLALHALHGDTRSDKLLAGLRREGLTGVLLGLGSGLIVGLVAWLWRGQAMVGVSLLASITVAVAAAAALGLLTPFLLHGLRQDPRVAAGPIALVCADLVTLLVYFNIADLLIS
jgi:magnesium transporter